MSKDIFDDELDDYYENLEASNHCCICDAEIPKGKVYCSSKCRNVDMM